MEDSTEYREKSKLAEAGEDILEGLHRKNIGDVAYGVACAVDALGPVGWSEVAWHWYYAKMQTAARADPVWRAIEDRRRVDGGASKIFLSDDLTWADYEVQRGIERRLTPEPLWCKMIRRAGEASVVRGLSEVTARYQRAKRGWSNRDVCGAGEYLATITADMLDHLAAHSYGWPGDEEFPTFEDWAVCLQEKAQDLRSWGNGTGHSAEVSEWYELVRNPEADTAAIDEARATMWAEDKARYEKAKAAMAWVAEHLGQIWD
jgi:hypothetical protein